MRPIDPTKNFSSPWEEIAPVAQPYSQMTDGAVPEHDQRSLDSSEGVNPWLNVDDAALLQCIAGDRQRGQQAFTELVRRHGPYLHAVARALAQEDAADVVQETFLAVLQSRFEGRSSVRTWLVQIAVRQAALLRRKRASQRGVQDPSLARSSQTASGHAGVDARMDLETVLAELSDEHRIVLMMRELDGMSYDQIAQALELPRGTVESRLHRARNALKERFKEFFFS